MRTSLSKSIRKWILIALLGVGAYLFGNYVGYKTVGKKIESSQQAEQTISKVSE